MLWVVLAIVSSLAAGAEAERRHAARAGIAARRMLKLLLFGLLAPAALAPPALVEASHVLLLAALPVGFFAAGIILAEARAEAAGRPRLEPPIGAVLVLRLVLAPLLLLALAAPLIDLPPAYLLLAAMPAGLNGLTVAHAFGLDLRFAAASIGWTTGVGVTAAAALTLAI